jgi:Glycosyl transferase family 2
MNDVPAAAQRSEALLRAPAAASDVTVVLTSCGRQDLLERTLDTFFLYNTYPIREFIVIEDGDRSLNDHLRPRYHKYGVSWLDTGRRVGQVTAIDLAYARVKTDFIFHCEDDWEFLRPRFIERSVVILNSRPDILMVSLRDKDDQNGYPVHDRVYFAEWVPYRLMHESYDAGEWGTWHGFAWNPGLRRRRDYELLGSFGSLDPLHAKPAWQMEREAGAFYREHGFAIALLAEDCGTGYVRHLGDDRHVREVRGRSGGFAPASQQ